jgi:hypothetical protein
MVKETPGESLRQKERVRQPNATGAIVNRSLGGRVFWSEISRLGQMHDICSLADGSKIAVKLLADLILL